MRARVIDVNERLVYLEVDQQLRFRSPYVARDNNYNLKRRDDVDFDFTELDGRACVVIKNIVHPNGSV